MTLLSRNFHNKQFRYIKTDSKKAKVTFNAVGMYGIVCEIDIAKPSMLFHPIINFAYWQIKGYLLALNGNHWNECISTMEGLNNVDVCSSDLPAITNQLLSGANTDQIGKLAAWFPFDDKNFPAMDYFSNMGYDYKTLQEVLNDLYTWVGVNASNSPFDNIPVVMSMNGVTSRNTNILIPLIEQI